MPVSDQRRSLTPPTRDSAASRNAAADVIRGQLDAIYSRTEEQNSAPEKAQPQPFSAQLQSKPEVRSEQPKAQIAKPQQISTAPQLEPKKDSVNHAMADGADLPKPRFSQSHKLAIPHPQTKPLKLKIQPSTLKFRRTSGSNTTVLGRNIIRCITSVTTLATSRQRIVKFLD